MTELIEKAVCDVLRSSIFQSSRQCQLLLRYIVDCSLTHQDDLLRERVIGAAVFGRAADYDTGNDPVVRARVAEVRKRLAQYYLDCRGEVAIQISIPKGSYRAVFSSSLQSPHAEPNDDASESDKRMDDLSHPLIATTGERKASTEEGRAKHVEWHHPLKSWIFLTALLVIIAVPGCRPVFQSWQNHRRTNLFEQFWAPLSNSSKPVVIYIGANSVYRLSGSYLENYRKQHHIQNAGLDFFIDLQPSQSISQGDLVPTNKLIGFGDVAAAARVASTLQSFKQKYDLRYGNDIAITDLQSSPAILIGGFSNAWTMQITHRLRYTLEDGHKIVDNNDRSKVWQWREDEAGGQQDDYVVLSRLVHSQTGGFVISIAGVASSSNQAAADFISDSRQIEKLLQHVPRGWENMNMQVVLHTTTINDVPTSIDVQAVYFW
jgi:hypothetical protein